MPSPSTAAASSSSDETLLLRYQEGDEEAFAQLYGRYRAGLWRFICGLCASTAQADEVFQETWLAVVQSPAAPDGRARFKTWLFQIARHRLIDGWRKHQREEMKSAAFDKAQVLDESEATPETLVLRAQQLQHIAAALQTLPLPQREVFLLRAHADMQLPEIATLTQTPLEAVKSRFRYALAKLRQQLGAVPPPTPTSPEMEVNRLP